VHAFEKGHSKLAHDLNASIGQLLHYCKLMYSCQSCVAVSIRQREAQALHRKVVVCIQSRTDDLIASSRKDIEQLVAEGKRCAIPPVTSMAAGALTVAVSLHARRDAKAS
jgi:hypothetical protein